MEHHAANARAARSRLSVHGLGYCRVDDHPAVAVDLNGEDTAPERAARVTAMTKPTAAALMTPRTRKAKSLSRVDIPREEPVRKSDPRLVGIEELEEGEGGEALMGSIYVVGERDEAGACSIDVDTRVSPADTQTSVGVAPVHSYQPWCWTIQAIRA